MTELASSLPVNRIRRRLLSWYQRHQRDLPWRGQKDPYRIWISEVMLQQTQVATVHPYYIRFLERFPTVNALAGASLDDVLKIWEGLGYYARARNLHAAAGKIVNEYGGQIPDNYAALHQLPGLGDYTAGAVASIAFNQAVPAVDGNVKRVLARLFAVDTDISQSSTVRRLKELAQLLVPEDRPGDFNQALMELGAMICLPTSPRCLLCPLRDDCQALTAGIQDSLPIRGSRPELPHHEVSAAVIRREDGFYLMSQRHHKGMLGGLWEFPGGKCQEEEPIEECLRHSVRRKLGVEVEVGRQLVTIRHAYTHFRITLHAFECRHLGGQPQSLDCAAWHWVSLENLADIALPVTDRKIADLLLAPASDSG